MKLFRLYTIGCIGILAAGIFIVSCTKSFDEKTERQTNFNNSTLTQVFVATVNAKRNYVYVDGKPVTGAVLASGGYFPLTGHAFNVPAGLHSFTIRDTLSTSTQEPLVFAENMEVAKKYTIFTYDTITNPQQKTVLTNIVVPSDTSSRIRLANFSYAPYALPGVDVFSFVQNQNLFTDIPVTGVTDFIAYPSRVTDTLYFRETGTMNQLFKLTIVGGISAKRHYTVVYHGSHQGTRVVTLFPNF